MPPYLRVMLVNCPQCSAAYEVPDRLLAAGPRLMKCAKCAHQFSAALATTDTAKVEPMAAPGPAPVAAQTQPETQPETPPEPPPPAPEPATRRAPLAAPKIGPAEAKPAPPKPSAKQRRLALLGWVTTLLLLLAAGGYVATNHAEIAEAWPPSGRLFAQIGLR